MTILGLTRFEWACICIVFGCLLAFALLKADAEKPWTTIDYCEQPDTLPASVQDVDDVRGLLHVPPVEITESIKSDREQFLEDAKRSPHWPTVEKHFKKLHPFCAYCGSTVNIQVHHIHQFKDMTDEQRGHDVPGGELSMDNLISLCERPPDDHHLRIGHFGNFKTSNPNVVEDCKANEVKMRAAGTWPIKE